MSNQLPKPAPTAIITLIETKGLGFRVQDLKSLGFAILGFLGFESVMGFRVFRVSGVLKAF
jgi:hypothetical protein